MPRHAIVTGGSSGIGRATARRLAADGLDVSLIARSPERLAAARDEVAAAGTPVGARVAAIAADVACREEVERAVARAIEGLGPPDLLVTSAGITQPGRFQELPVEAFERLMAVNYFGTLWAVRAVLPVMTARRQGHLALVASGLALYAIYGYSAYSPTKFALRGLAETLRAELAPVGIGVSLVCPAETDTPMLREERAAMPPETRRILAGSRTWSADEVAAALLRGVRRRRFVVAPGLEMGLVARLHSLLGPALDWYVDRRARRGA
jgi:3-dehydrosphinganine reductase